MADEPTTTIRWVWGYDELGVRITEAEAVAFINCESCGDIPPSRSALRVMHLKARPGMEARRIAGITNGEFFPDD